MTPGDWAAWTQSRGRDHCASRGGWRSDLAAEAPNDATRRASKCPSAITQE